MGDGSNDAEALEPVAVEIVDQPRVAATLERIPDPNVREAVRGVIVAQSHIGPLPPAELLAQYDAVLPGLAREIADNSKAEQTHRHSMDRRTGTQEFTLNLVGLVAILIALAMMLAIVAYMVSTGNAIPGATLGGAIIVSVVVALTNYRKSGVTSLPETKKSDAADE